MKEPTRIGIWIRVSTDMQVKDDSPEHHEQRARAYIAHNEGWQVVEVYRLDAVSGKAVMHHPEAQRMLKDVRSGHIEALVFSKLARLARSTKELLEFATIFREENAHLISLAEKIDTSTPAGMLFFTIISAMAQWEREEISARVAASVPIRAQLGKSLGGQATFGYRWEGNTFLIDEKEAPIRKLLYELFLKHQRKKSTARALNELGHRTRNGALFSDTTVERLIKDPTAKGERRANYTKSKGEGKHWIEKPKEEWISLPCPAIVDAELWEKCNQILSEQQERGKRLGPKTVYLLAGYVRCECGTIMYVYSTAKNYSCKACKNRIAVEDLDEIYQEYLKGYLSDINPMTYHDKSVEQIEQLEHLLENTKAKLKKIDKEMDELVPLRLSGELTKEHFAKLYKPLEQQEEQLRLSLPELEADIDFKKVQLASSDIVLTESKALYENWKNMPFEQKRSIIETITEHITIGKDEITIALANISHSLNAQTKQHDFRDS